MSNHWRILVVAALLAVLPRPASAQGYADWATGGAGGPLVFVTSTEDDGPGSLRRALAGGGPRWVVLASPGEIRLRSPVSVPSDVTLDGRGVAVTIVGHGLDVRGSRNVRITGITVRDCAGDAISIRDGADLVSIDHVTATGCSDGLVDVTRSRASLSRVSIAWSKFHDHPKAILLGGHDWHTLDRNLRVTIHHTLFERVERRAPRLRHGVAHVYNTAHVDWSGEAIEVSDGGRLLVEGSQFVPGPSSKLAIRLDGGAGWVARTDLGGARAAQGGPLVLPPYPYRVDPPAGLLARLVRSAGDK